MGYASAIGELARIMGDSMQDIKNKFVAATTSEILTPAYKELIETNLCSKVYDQYGSQEGCHLAMQCSMGNMHVHPLFGIIEIVDADGQPCKDGETGRVLVTSLFRHTMPLIRYELGDEAVINHGNCQCGLQWPLIGSIAGRSEDLVITPDGRRIGYLNFHSTKDLLGIVESQLVQKAPNRFIFRIVLSQQAKHNAELIIQNEQRILAQIRNRLGYDAIEVSFDYLSSIPRDDRGRGKFKAVIVDMEV